MYFLKCISRLHQKLIGRYTQNLWINRAEKTETWLHLRLVTHETYMSRRCQKNNLHASCILDESICWQPFLIDYILCYQLCDKQKFFNTHFHRSRARHKTTSNSVSVHHAQKITDTLWQICLEKKRLKINWFFSPALMRKRRSLSFS